MRVFNRWSATVCGIPAGTVGDVEPWQARQHKHYLQPASQAPQGGADVSVQKAEGGVRELRKRIRKSDDLEFLETMLADPRRTLQREARARLARLGHVEPEDGEPEDGEPEDGEPEDGEPEDGEA